jgi:NAD(P)H dehydrogenase (quinone)
MSTSKPKVLVLGATGQAGQGVVEILKNHPEIESSPPLVRRKSEEPWGARRLPRSRQAEVHRLGLLGHRPRFLVTGYTIDMMRQSKDFLNIAKKVGVKHIVHLGACSDNDTRVAHCR